VDGWHVSRELGIAIVSLRLVGTLWIDVKDDAAAALLPAWLRERTQWGRIQFRARPMPIGTEWIAPVMPAAFVSGMLGLKVLDVHGQFHWGLLLLFIFLGPIVGIVGCLGMVIAIVWHPSIELEGKVARVFWGHETVLPALRVQIQGSRSQCGQLVLNEARPSWQGGLTERLFRPATVFTAKQRLALGYNEAEVIRRIIEERARPQDSVYRA